MLYSTDNSLYITKATFQRTITKSLHNELILVIIWKRIFETRKRIFLHKTISEPFSVDVLFGLRVKLRVPYLRLCVIVHYERNMIQTLFHFKQPFIYDILVVKM
jgi:hypothetical protein